jgi:hypothetical protein
VKHSAALMIVDAPVLTDWRPRTRGDCADGPRPCPFIGCRYHLLSLRVRGSGAITIDGTQLQLDADADIDQLESFAEAIVSRLVDKLARHAVLLGETRREAHAARVTRSAS